MQETWVRSLGWEDLLRRERLSTPVLWPGEFYGVAKSQTQLSNFHFHSSVKIDESWANGQMSVNKEWVEAEGWWGEYSCRRRVWIVEVSV